MAMTEQDMQKQAQLLAEMKEELSRLEATEQALNKQLSDAGITVDLDNLPPELQNQMQEAMQEAKRAGEARSTQFAAEHGATKQNRSTPGAGRKGIIRM